MDDERLAEAHRERGLSAKGLDLAIARVARHESRPEPTAITLVTPAARARASASAASPSRASRCACVSITSGGGGGSFDPGKQRGGRLDPLGGDRLARRDAFPAEIHRLVQG